MPNSSPASLHRAAVALAAASLLWAGCGPLAAGGDARYTYRPDGTYPVTAGETAVVEAEWSLSAAGVSRSELRRRNVNWVPSGFRGDTANAGGWVSLEPSSVPNGWEFTLRQARVVRERELGQRGDDAVYRHFLRVRLSATPPESAHGLTRRLSGDVVVRDGERLPVTFLVQAR